MNDKLVEFDLPLETISQESAREKNIRHGHPSTLHIWWARRPLSASRTTTFSSLVEDPGEQHPKERDELISLISKISTWESIKDGNSHEIEKARDRIIQEFDGENPKVLDPFAGGGSIPLEALRLGCETHSLDYNPVAVFIQKLTIEWPQKFGVSAKLPESERPNLDQQTKLSNSSEENHLLAHLVEKWASKLEKSAKSDIGEYYPTYNDPDIQVEKDLEDDNWIPVCYIWARELNCQNPNCNAKIPLIKSFWLSKKEGQNVAYKPTSDSDPTNIDFEILEGEDLENAMENGFSPSEGTITRGNAKCLICDQVTEVDKIREIFKNQEVNERIVAIAYRHPKVVGKRYRVASEDDMDDYRKSQEHLEKEVSEWPYLENPIPEEELPPVGTLGFRVNRYGIKKWCQLFNDRQLLSHIHFIRKIRESYPDILEEVNSILDQNPDLNHIDAEEFTKAIQAYLAAIQSNLADYNAKLCVLNSTGGRGVVHVFGRQALPMSWDYAETNVFNPAGASWQAAAENTVKAIRFLKSQPEGSIKIQQNSATSLSYDDDTFDAVITDPPYYDNVPYSSLSDFFYVWLKRSIGDQFPSLFSTSLTPKKDEAIMDPSKHESPDAAKMFFEQMLSKSFHEMNRVLDSGGIFVGVYAHKTTDGWETMLNALLEAGFVVTASWPIHTEKRGRLREIASAALASSIYMVCRKIERQEIGYWSEIKPSIEENVETKLEHFWEKGIVGGDFFISAIGPGMAEFSKFKRVETYSGEQVDTDELLQFIRSVSADFLVNQLLQDASSERIDEASMFYLTYRWTYMDNKVEFDDAKKLANAEGVDLEQLWGSDGFVKKTRKYIHVYGPKERGEIDRVDNMVDAVHKAAQLWEKGEKGDLGEFLSSSGYGDLPAFWQFCQAIAECLVNGTKEKQLLEGLLMSREDYTDYTPSRTDTTLEEFATEGGR